MSTRRRLSHREPVCRFLSGSARCHHGWRTTMDLIPRTRLDLESSQAPGPNSRPARSLRKNKTCKYRLHSPRTPGPISTAIRMLPSTEPEYRSCHVDASDVRSDLRRTSNTNSCACAFVCSCVCVCVRVRARVCACAWPEVFLLVNDLHMLS